MNATFSTCHSGNPAGNPERIIRKFEKIECLWSSFVSAFRVRPVKTGRPGMTVILLAALMMTTACKKAPDTISEPAVATATQTIYLVRHAEKQKGDNPSLTKAGHERAQLIKDMLGDKGVTYVHSTNLNRTLETAAPLADSLGLDIQIYDAKDLEGFAKTLRAIPGVHLVVGHSNTTPDLVAHLNGEAINLMPETEYDRFTMVKLGKDGKAVTDITRFGK